MEEAIKGLRRQPHVSRPFETAKAARRCRVSYVCARLCRKAKGKPRTRVRQWKRVGPGSKATRGVCALRRESDIRGWGVGTRKAEAPRSSPRRRRCANDRLNFAIGRLASRL
eukprot:4111711-Pleurochrysis_carterae.AAC.1